MQVAGLHDGKARTLPWDEDSEGLAVVQQPNLRHKPARLAAGTLGTGNTTMFTAGVDYGAVTILLTNNDTVARTFELHHVLDGNSPTDGNLLGAKTVSLAAGAHWGIRGVPLKNTDFLSGLCSSANSVSYLVWSTPGAVDDGLFAIFTSELDPSGTLNGPGSSTDNALVRWDGTGGTDIQDSGWLLSDAGALTAAGNLDMAANDIDDVAQISFDTAGHTADGTGDITFRDKSLQTKDNSNIERRIVLQNTQGPAAGNLLIHDGGTSSPSSWPVVAMSGDATIASGGALTLASAISTDINFTGELKIGGVTVFVQDAKPTENATDDLWLETDTNIWWYWDGGVSTGKWLSCQLFKETMSFDVASAGINHYFGHQISSVAAYDIYFVDLTADVKVASGTPANDYWLLRSFELPGSGLDSFLTNLDTYPNYTTHTSATNTYRDISSTAPDSFLLQITVAAGSPGAITGSLTQTFRWVHL